MFFRLCDKRRTFFLQLWFLRLEPLEPLVVDFHTYIYTGVNLILLLSSDGLLKISYEFIVTISYTVS